MRNKFQHVTAEGMHATQSLHDPIAKLSRKDLLTIQYTKMLNYFRNELDPTWGGGSDENEYQHAELGYQRFLEDVDAFGDAALPRWIHRRLDAAPWSADNFELREHADSSLGYPYEPYIAVNGSILTINQASRILSVDRMALVRVKCSLLIDRRVIEFAIKEMLKPRPLWPRIHLQRGGKGRSYRFA